MIFTLQWITYFKCIIYYFLSYDIVISEIHSLVKENELESALQLIKQLNEDLELEFELVDVKSRIYIKLGLFDEAKTVINTYYYNREDLDLQEYFHIKLLLLEIDWYLGQYRSFNIIVNDLNHQMYINYNPSNPSYSKILIRLKLFQGIHCNAMGNLDDAHLYFQDCLSLINNIDDSELLAQIYIAIGNNLRYFGQLRRALEKYSEALVISKRNSYKYLKLVSKINLGIVFSEMGDLHLAQDYLNNALLESEKFKLDILISQCKRELGSILLKQREFHLAEEYFTYSLNHSKRLKNPIESTIDLYRLLNLFLELRNYEDAGLCLLNIQKIKEVFDIKFINQCYELSLAKVIRVEYSVKSLNTAFEIVENIIHSDKVYHEFELDARIFHCELLLLEKKLFNHSKNDRIIEDSIDEIYDFLTIQKSVQTTIECMVIQAQLFFYNLDFDIAKMYLSNAGSLASDNGFNLLDYKIDLLLKQIDGFKDSWNKINTIDSTIFNNCNTDILKEALFSLEKHTTDLLHLKEEYPVMVLILSDGGISIYDKPLSSENSEIQTNDFVSVISSYLGNQNEINPFANKVKIDDYTIILIPNESIVFCYAFKGNSIKAIQKLEKFVTTLRKMPKIWDQINFVFPSITTDTSKQIELVINKIFY